MISRSALRAAYDAVIAEIDHSRKRPQLTNGFYSQIGNSIFDACYSALERALAAREAQHLPKRLHVVSAPMGSGKTTFSIAFAAAYVRLGEHEPALPQGVVFLVEQRPKAQEMYDDLAPLLPGQVAIWTSDHDVNCASPEKVTKADRPRFSVDDLERYPVVIVTHAFFKGQRGRKARKFVRDGESQTRALAIIDEQANDVRVYDTSLAAASMVLEAVQGDEGRRETAALPLQSLIKFMAEKAEGGGSLEASHNDPPTWEASADALQWFTTAAAKNYARKHQQAHPDIEAVFGFARSLAEGYAFITRYSNDGTRFVGYENTFVRMPGMVLIDATADLDGITQLCPWRVEVPVPKADYTNLDVVHVQPFTGRKLSRFFSLPVNRRDYAQWMVDTIIANMEPGQKGLVVCHNKLFKERHVPAWDFDDWRWDQPDTFTDQYGWNVDGRHLCATWWGGPGIGANTWKDADVVFLFDEWHLPRRIIIATAQGLKDAKANEGPLRCMRTSNARSRAVDVLSDGHLLRWIKQMALRGKGRHFNPDGRCGHQKVVFTGSYDRLVMNADRLFPGAEITQVRREDDLSQHTKASSLLEFLGRHDLPATLSAASVAEKAGYTSWSAAAKEILKRPGIRLAFASLGWTLVQRRGRGGSYFERIGRADVPEDDTNAGLKAA